MQQTPESHAVKQAVLFQLADDAERAVTEALEGQQILVKRESLVADLRRILKTDHPDYIFVGSSYLLKRGEALLSSIKRGRPNIPIIVTVADKDRERVLPLLGSHVSGYLCQPYYQKEVLFTLSTVGRMTGSNIQHSVAGQLVTYLGNAHKVFIGRSRNAQQVRRDTAAARKGNGHVLFIGENGTGKTQLSFCVHLKPGQLPAPMSILDPLVNLKKKRRSVSLFDDAYPSGSVIVKNSQHLAAREAALVNSMLCTGAGSGRKPPRLIVHHDPASGIDERFDRSCFAHIITIEPLRQRSEDIGAIFGYFVNNFSSLFGNLKISITPSARKVLMGYSWPRNVRDLIGLVIFLMVTETGGVIDPASLPDFITRSDPDPLGRISLEHLLSSKLRPIVSQIDLNRVEGLYNIIMARVEVPLIKLVLERTDRNQSRAAKILGINRNTLKKKIDEYRLSK
jgi:two-component system, NtrC family, nitrogen regulation response regulator GlnG